MKPFHLSIGVKSIEDSVNFFTEVLPGKVTHRDEAGYVNLVKGYADTYCDWLRG